MRLLDPDHCLLRLVPDGFLKGLVPAIEQAYHRTERALLDLPDPEAADLRGVRRRAEVEGAFSRLVIKNGGECPAERNQQNTSSFRLGRFDNVNVTIHKVGHVGAVPRHAEFRGQLAWDRQFDLFRGPEPDPSPTDPVYLVVTHGPHPETFLSPGFVLLAQPDARFRSYCHRVELLGRFGQQETSDSLVPEESIPRELSIKVRKIKTEDAG